MKKVLFLAVAFILALSAATQVFATTTRTLVIEEVTGTVNMTRGTARSFDARVGTRLSAGNTLSTGTSSNASLLLDDGSVMRLNASTTIDITRAGNLMEISVVTGSVSVHAQPQAPNNQLQVTAGNATMGIRGTLFTVVLTEGTVYVNLLEGVLEGTTPAGPYVLQAGQTLVVCETEEPETRPLELDLLDQFTLETIYEHVDLLLYVGTIHRRDITTVGQLIEVRQAETAEREEARLLAVEEVLYVPECEAYIPYEATEYVPANDTPTWDNWDSWDTGDTWDSGDTTTTEAPPQAPTAPTPAPAPAPTPAPAPPVVEEINDDEGEYEYYEDDDGTRRRRRRWRWRSSGR